MTWQATLALANNFIHRSCGESGCLKNGRQVFIVADQRLAPYPVALRTILSTEFVQKSKKCPPAGQEERWTFFCEVFTHGKNSLTNQGLFTPCMALLTILSTDYVKKCTSGKSTKNANAHFLCLRIIRFPFKGLAYKSCHSPQFCPQNMCRTGPSIADEIFCIRKNHSQIMGLGRNSGIANSVVHRKCEECTHLPVSARQATLRVYVLFHRSISCSQFSRPPAGPSGLC